MTVISGNTISGYRAQVVAATDYSPFGTALAGRMYTIERGYRYGFNGMERETSITADNYDFCARIMDARLGRWLSVDGHYYNYPAHSVYAFALDNPVYFIDPDGNDVIGAIVAGVMSLASDIGAQFLEGYLLRNESFELAWDNVSIWSASLGAGAEALKKLPTPPGLGWAQSVSDFANSKVGVVLSAFVLNVIKEAQNRYHQGYYTVNGELDYDKLFSTEEIIGLMLDGLAATFIEKGFTAKAEELINQYRSKYSCLQKHYDKLHALKQNAPQKAVDKRIEKIDAASKQTLNAGGKIVTHEATKQGTTIVTKKAVGELKPDPKKGGTKTDAEKKQEADKAKSKGKVGPIPPAIGG
jgi:RHS repeat-associated protein